MEWRNASKRSKLLIFDGSVLAPILLCMVAFNVKTIMFLLAYAAVSAYIAYRGLTMAYILRRIRFTLRGGVVLARPESYWRKLLG